ncbi:hypothetical protein BLOT_000659 [Blomia tropicalis]|nr:hypothetical protein BLOT_000659 [Blomia tropicalis]
MNNWKDNSSLKMDVSYGKLSHQDFMSHSLDINKFVRLPFRVDDDEVLDVGSFDDANSNEYGGVADFCFAFDEYTQTYLFKV